MFLLLRIQLQSLLNSIKNVTRGEVFKWCLLGALGIVFMICLFLGFLRLLSAVKGVEIIGNLLLAKLTGMGFLTLFVLVAISAIVVAFSTLYSARDWLLLVASPMSLTNIFASKVLETTVYSSWTVALILLPFFLAYSFAYNLGWRFVAIAGALTVPYLSIASCVGIMLAMFMVFLLPKSKAKEIVLVSVVVIGAGIYVLIRWLEPVKLTSPQAFEAITDYIALLKAPAAPYLASWWLTQVIINLTFGHWYKVVVWGVLLVLGCMTVNSVMIFGGIRMFFAGWNRFQNSVDTSFAADDNSKWKTKSPLMAMLNKDYRLFCRDIAQWSQMLFLVALAVVYLVSIIKLPLDNFYLKSLASFLNIGTAGVVISSISLRFAFPAISREGYSWWLLRQAPIGVGLILREKFLLCLPILIFPGTVLVGLSSYLLGVDRFVMWLSVVTIPIMAIALCSMGLGLGAVFPRFNVENLSKIEASPGGIFFMICALFYVGLMLSLEAVLMQIRFKFLIGMSPNWLPWVVVWIICGICLITFITVFLPLSAGKKSLERGTF